MKKLLLHFVVLFLATSAFAQTYTHGRLTVVNQASLTRDSTDCRIQLNQQLNCTITNSTVTDTVQFYLYGSMYDGKVINTNATNPFIFNRSTPGFYKSDYHVVGDTAHFNSSAYKIICGIDTIFAGSQALSRPWPNPCIYDSVQGRMFIDLDSNCIGPYVNEPAVNFSPIASDTVYNGTIKKATFSFAGDGSYNLILQKSFRSGCSISLPPVLQFLYPNSNCINQSYSFYDMPYDSFDYAFRASSMVNVVAGASTTNAVRPQMPFILYASVYNMGYNPVSGKLYLVLDPHVTYNSSLSTHLPTSISGDTLIWNFSYLSAGGMYNTAWWNSFLSSIHLTPDNTLAAGDSVCFSVFTSPVLNDVDSTDNYKTFCLTLVSSFDPNVKQVNPVGDGPLGVIPATTKELTYTVHFQNTGTASAFNVYVLDTLNANLDSSSLQILTTSHTMNAEWVGGRVVKFNFANINLPDSLHNEPKSHGSFSYKVNLKPNLVPGTQITNTAAIYFDNNAPVLTNTTLNTIATPSALKNTDAPLALSVYPNPTKGQVTVSLSKPVNNVTLKLINVTGQSVFLQNRVNGSLFTFSVADQPAGIYILELTNGTGSQRTMLVKQF